MKKFVQRKRNREREAFHFRGEKKTGDQESYGRKILTQIDFPIKRFSHSSEMEFFYFFLLCVSFTNEIENFLLNH